ncbi:hypothetical protein M0R04_08470 [Candidatus Dojkabacteria bacterium]|jgi:hypothetical protein|nr:hypothetical protein [Candidatus Dojkabacteria bacterium]
MDTYCTVEGCKCRQLDLSSYFKSPPTPELREKIHIPESELTRITVVVFEWLKQVYRNNDWDSPSESMGEDSRELTLLLIPIILSLLPILSQAEREKERRIKGWSYPVDERVTYFDKSGDVDEAVMANTNVHMESMSDEGLMLIMDNGKKSWHFYIGSVSGRAKVHILLQEDNDSEGFEK